MFVITNMMSVKLCVPVMIPAWSLMLGAVSCVTTRVRTEGVAAVCAGAEEAGLTLEADIENIVDNCVCEKYHLLWPSDKVRQSKGVFKSRR